MLRLGRLPDYGLVIAATFIGVDDLLTTNDVVQRSGIPLATVRKLLKSMVDSGLVESFRGKQGGYRLARPAAKISVADVIQAIDGPICLTECSNTDSADRCYLEARCPLALKWCRLNNEIVEKLQSVSIQEVVA
ncbi:MAG: Rrf2 family transcriptional regulator [Gammaproteobacteria bacterium]|jgi:FeS assembly SUF system regulator|nr:Rrf2 family transcriptional regulator [Gammaproteobacteria bacterium]MDP6617067.1 Rrf2 family transcriptional regulator [Gammaproteobacteria bacterium]